MDILQPYQGKYVNADSAITKLDIETILNGCDAVENDTLSIDDLSKMVINASETLDEKTLSINGNTFIGQIDSDVQNISSVKNQIIESISTVREVSIYIYNQIQDQMNADAETRDIAEIRRREQNNNG